MALPATCSPHRCIALFVAALSVFVLLPPATATAADAGGGALVVTPPTLSLDGSFARAQMVVTRRVRTGRIGPESADWTRKARYVSSNEEVVRVSSTGQARAVSNGRAAIRITVEDRSREIPVQVTGIADQPQVDFVHQVMPIINKAGCNMGACHAAQHGQGGLKLSVFGFEPGQDWQAMVRDRHQRRVNLLDPERSLLVAKPTLATGHGGGRRLEPGSVDHQVLTAWIAGGTPGVDADAPQPTGIRVQPWRRNGRSGMQQQLRVEATYSDGTTRDVTHWARFDSLDENVVSVDDSGYVTVTGKGQVPVMVRFDDQVETALFVVPYTDQLTAQNFEPRNFVDELARAKFQELGIEPAPLCDDATFLRRAFLDAIGTLPTKEETVRFLDSTDPEKREKLVDRLLGLTGDPDLDIYNDAYAAYWTLKWSDLIRTTSRDLGDQGMWSLHNWIRESLRTGKPFDQFVGELVTAKGSIYMTGPANYYRINRGATDLTEATTQLFLGIRLECAKCHHHPFEKYSQADYYGMAAFFARVGTKNSEEFGLFGRETVVVVKSSGGVSHPRTGKVMSPTPLEGEPMDHPLDRRIPLADWLTSPENEYFARSVVNRYVGYLLGRGLVEPIDDMRSTNPASNPPLLDALARDFTASGFDLKHLIRTIMTSRLYQLDWQPTASSSGDGRYYSHYRVKRILAEPLLDAIDRVTGVRTKFSKLPQGTRAIELPDAEYPNYFLKTFAKPARKSVCECERTLEENLAQALHTLNGDILMEKIADGQGRIARLLAATTPHDQIVAELYLVTLCRYPTYEERAACRQFLQESPGPQVGYEDLLWALVNSKQFLFVH